MTTRHIALGAVLGFVAGCTLPPQDVTAQDMANFDAAVASIGCDLVGESDYLPVELQAGLTREQVTQIAQFRLASEDAVRLENGGVRLTSGPCAPA